MEDNKEHRPLFFAISGYKHTGKTTMVDRVIPVLKSRGLKVAVIKHDGHDFEGDVPGTDSYKHHQAGAYGSAVFSKNRVLIQKDIRTEDNDEAKTEMIYRIAAAFPEADVILLEGFKHCDFPRYWCNYPEEPLIPAEELADRICALL